MNAGVTGLTGKRLGDSISKAIDFLVRSQLPHGEFRTYASPDPEMRARCVYDSSPFVTSLVLYSIALVDSPRACEITAKALDFLLAEMEGPGLWRFWSSRNQRHKLLPPDLDDTCCISYVLEHNCRTLPSNRDAILANRNSQGLFYTWLVPRSSSPPRLADDLRSVVNQEAIRSVSLFGMVDDVDCVANANALLYLGDNKDTEPVTDYLIAIGRGVENDGCSKFYPERLCLYYALSRAYHHGILSLKEISAPVTDRVIRMQGADGSFGNELLTALAACTLLNFEVTGSAVHNAVRCVCESQREDGSWPRISMFLGPAPHYGSEDLTTALCVEALEKYCQVAGFSV
jgi:hypothetical protein